MHRAVRMMMMVVMLMLMSIAYRLLLIFVRRVGVDRIGSHFSGRRRWLLVHRMRGDRSGFTRLMSILHHRARGCAIEHLQIVLRELRWFRGGSTNLSLDGFDVLFQGGVDPFLAGGSRRGRWTMVGWGGHGDRFSETGSIDRGRTIRELLVLTWDTNENDVDIHD